MELSSARVSMVSPPQNRAAGRDTTGYDQSNRPMSARAPLSLLAFCGAALFPVFNQFGSQLWPNDEQAISTVVQQTKSGDPVNQVAIVSLGLIGAWLLVRYRNQIRWQHSIAIILFALLTWSAFSALWSIDPALTSKRLVELALVLLFCGGLVLRVGNIAICVFIAGFISVSLLAGIVYEVARGLFYPLSTDYRFCGTGPHPNVEGSVLSAAVIVLGWLCFRTTGRRRMLFLGLTIGNGIFMLLTRSRSSLLALVVALIFSFALVMFRDHKRRIGVVIASLVLIVSMGVFLDLAVPDGSSLSPFATALHRSDDEEGPTSLSGRVALWKSLLPYISERPITGYGFAGFWTPKHIENVSADQKWVIQQSHSGYIDQTLALGVPGGTLYVCLLLYSIGWGVLQFHRGDDGCGAWAAILVFIALHNLTESINVSFSFTSLLFYLIVLRFAIVRVESAPYQSATVVI